MAESFLLGMNAKLYQGASDDALDSMSVVDHVRDVTVTMDSGEADITTRGNSGWRATAATLRECSVEFEMLWKPGDAIFEAIKNAFLSAGTVELAALDQARDVTGAQGPKGNFAITSFSRSEPLEEAITVSVTAKLAKYNDWVEVGS